MRGNAVEAGFDITASDGVKGTAEPVGEIALDEVAIALVGDWRPVGIGRHEFIEGLPQSGHAAGLGALVRRVAAAGDVAQYLMGHAPRPVGRYPVAAPKHDALVGGLPAAVAGAVVDDVGLAARGINANSEASEPVVPCGVGFVPGFEGLDGARGEGHPTAGCSWAVIFGNNAAASVQRYRVATILVQ